MKPEIKAKWVKALRSGKYKQSRYGLKVGRGFCCLGVLCDLHAKETKGEWETRYGTPIYLEHEGSLPPAVQRWAGFRTDSPCVAKGELACLNDGNMGYEPHSFKQIADLIEKHL
jgi:hypothetical protein